MKRNCPFSILGLIAISLVMASFALAETPRAQKPAEKLQKPLPSLSKQRCSIDEISYSPASGLKLLTYGKLVIKYRCDGKGSVGPVEIEVQDGAGKVHAAKRDILFESGVHVLNIDIWQWQNYAYSNKIVTIIKFKGREVYKRTDMVIATEWFIANPEVLLNEPIIE